MTLFVSADGLAEAEDVLGRAKTRKQFPHLNDASVAAFLDRIRATATVIDTVPATYHFARDPKDEHVINLALACGARYLVTRDNDLLDLMRPDTADARAFAARFPALTILDPVAFLAAVPPAP